MGAPGRRTVEPDGYADYIRSAAWARTRRRYWNSKMPKRCFVCGRADGPMDLHHKTYKNLGNERLMDLVPVCRPCHDTIHAGRRPGEDLWRATNRIAKRARRRR